MEPAKLTRFVRGDLDWIVMKALAKERDRRYDSAIGLAQRHRAVPEPRAGRGRAADGALSVPEIRAAQPRPVIAASLVLFALVLGVIGTTLGLFEAKRQAALADGRRKEAEKRLAQRDKANEILLSIFQDLNPRSGTKDAAPLRLG